MSLDETCRTKSLSSSAVPIEREAEANCSEGCIIWLDWEVDPSVTAMG